MLSIKLQGQEVLSKKLGALAKSISATEILDESSAILFQRIRKRFLAEEDPDGVKWVKSKAALQRARTGRGGGTLYDTGRLFHSIQLYSTGSNSRAIGTNVSYAGIHNNGVGIIRRTFLGFGEEDITLVERLIIKRVNEAIK